MSDEGQRKLEQAYDGLEREAPDKLAKGIRWLRDPKSKKFRLPLGFLFIVGGIFGFLPVLGIEMIPLGLLLVAQDIPFLQKPVGEFTLWLERKWIEFRVWWQNRKRARKTRAT